MILNLMLVKAPKDQNRNHLVKCTNQKFTWMISVGLCNNILVLARQCCVPPTIFEMLINMYSITRLSRTLDLLCRENENAVSEKTINNTKYRHA
jgi:hypothetical protein